MARIYTTLAQLQQAYAGDGELDGTSLAIDNDVTAAAQPGSGEAEPRQS